MKGDDLIISIVLITLKFVMIHPNFWSTGDQIFIAIDWEAE